MQLFFRLFAWKIHHFLKSTALGFSRGCLAVYHLSALQRGFSTGFSSPPFAMTRAEACREAALKRAEKKVGSDPPAEAGGNEEPAEAG